jgi:hypothetical protein
MTLYNPRQLPTFNFDVILKYMYRKKMIIIYFLHYIILFLQLYTLQLIQEAISAHREELRRLGHPSKERLPFSAASTPSSPSKSLD